MYQHQRAIDLSHITTCGPQDTQHYRQDIGKLWHAAFEKSIHTLITYHFRSLLSLSFQDFPRTDYKPVSYTPSSTCHTLRRTLASGRHRHSYRAQGSRMAGLGRTVEELRATSYTLLSLVLNWCDTIRTYLTIPRRCCTDFLGRDAECSSIATQWR